MARACLLALAVLAASPSALLAAAEAPASPSKAEAADPRFQQIDAGFIEVSLQLAALEGFLDRALPLMARAAKHAAAAPKGPSPWTPDDEKAFHKTCLSTAVADAVLLGPDLAELRGPGALIPKNISEDWPRYYQCLAFVQKSPQPCASLAAADALIARKRPRNPALAPDDETLITAESRCRERSGMLRFSRSWIANGADALELCLAMETEEYVPGARRQACDLLASRKDSRAVCGSLLPIMRKDDPEIDLDHCLSFVGRLRGDPKACAAAPDPSGRLDCEAAAAYVQALAARNPEPCRGDATCRALMDPRAESCAPLLGRIKDGYCRQAARLKKAERIAGIEEFNRRPALPAELQREVKALILYQRERPMGVDEFNMLGELHKYAAGERSSDSLSKFLIEISQAKSRTLDAQLHQLSAALERFEPRSASGRKSRLQKLKALAKRWQAADKRIRPAK